jgi:hypothetical protein
MKIFSLVGKVLDFEDRSARLKSMEKRSLRGPAPASWKDEQSPAGRATYSPQREAPFFPEEPKALQFWVWAEHG